MLVLSSVRKKIIITMALCMLGISQVFAAASNCRPSSLGESINISIGFDITNNTAAIPTGKNLASMQSSFISLTCYFSGGGSNIYFRSSMPENIRSMLINSGVEVFQEYNVGGTGEYNITQPGTSDVLLGHWGDNQPNRDISFGIRYMFNVKKGTGALKPFDTGVFQLGYHVNDEGQNIGAPVFARFLGNLTLLCPAPKVNIAASNGGSVNFGTLNPKDLYNGTIVNQNLNLNMVVTPDCETGLNISVRFEPNNNTVLDNKNLDMGNGLQVLLKNSNGDVAYNELYFVGELMPFTPVNLPYTATLSHIPGRDIVSGPFSKTIRVVVSY